MFLPKVVKNIIVEYKNSLEHYERFKPTLEQIPRFYMIIRRSHLNRQFRTLFYPNFYTELILTQFPHLLHLEFEEPDNI